MSYRPTGNEPRGEWARFLIRQRQERDWSATQAFEALREGLRLGPKSRAAYLRFETGDRVPDKAEQDFFVTFFGSGPNDKDRAGVAARASEGSDLTAAIREAGALHAAAIDRQTAVMAELVEELRKLAWANVDLHQEVGEVLGRVRVFPSPATFRSDAPEQDWPGSPPAAPPESRGSR